MSYHNGSVWPHDNAIIASDLAKFGMKDDPSNSRRPCSRRPCFWICIACQNCFVDSSAERAWDPPCTRSPVPLRQAAAAVFLLLQASLGIEVTSSPPTVLFRRSQLPESVSRVEIQELQVGAGSVEVYLERAGQGVAITVLRKPADVEIISIK
jgi:glycogen debranching enzyme